MIVNKNGTLLKVKSQTITYGYCGNDLTSIAPRVGKFIAVFSGSSNIKGLDFPYWIFKILNQKVIIKAGDTVDSEFDLSIKRVYNSNDPYLIVEELGTEYLLKTLYSILSTLLEDGSELVSLELIEW